MSTSTKISSSLTGRILQSLSDPQVYSSSEIKTVLKPFLSSLKTVSKKKIKYYNIPCSFDIETSSFYEEDQFSGTVEKCGVMYVWQFAIYGFVFIGRTWEEYHELVDVLHDILKLSPALKLIVYVHNLSYEFQFMRKWFEWSRVFALRPRTPVEAETDNIIYRCSYLLSGYSLETIGKNLLTYKARKLTGNLDYDKIRHSGTPLTEEEIAYCINDVIVVNCYIQEKIDAEKSIARIPLTKTGYVRRLIRKNCLYGGLSDHKKSGREYKRYRAYMNVLTVDPEEYRVWKSAFQGGFTHASYNHSRQILYNVESRDITSSYPYAMVSEMYPSSRGELVEPTSVSDFEERMKKYCLVFEIRFDDLEAINASEHYLSASKCKIIGEYQGDNGRVVTAKTVSTVMTEVDYFIMKKYYRWSRIAIGKCYQYRRAYLPKNFILSILTLYRDKTTLKGVENKEREYQSAKENVNSAYGCCVMDICRPEFKYDQEKNEWNEPEPADLIASIEKYNTGKTRFLSYLWGIYVTAYARRNLFALIYNIGFDYVYSDTDSIKFLHPGKYDHLFDAYNKKVEEKLDRVCAWFSIDRELTRPKTIKGVEKMLGVYDPEGVYSIFKTLGAKRYMTLKDGKISITVSGVNKKTAVPFLLDRASVPRGPTGEIDYSDMEKASRAVMTVFREFDDNLCIPGEYTGKKTLTYIDEDIRGVIRDYRGEKAEFYEKSCIHMESAEYNLSLSSAYLNYLFLFGERDEF